MKKSGGGKISLLANNKDTKDRCWCNCFIVAKAICAAVFVCVGGRGIMSTTVLEGEKKWVFLFRNEETRLDTWFGNDHVFAEVKVALIRTAQTLFVW